LLLQKEQPVGLGQRPDVWAGTLDMAACKLSEGAIALLGQILAFDPGEPPAEKPAPPTAMPKGGAVLPRLLLERTLAGGAPQFGRRFVCGVRLRNCGLDVHTSRLLLAARPGVQELWLGQNNVGDAAADCVTQCPRLTKLGLEKGHVYDAHAVRLAEALLPVEGKDPPLEELHLGTSPFGGNHVGVKGAEGFSQVLMKNRTLRVLRLDNNPLGDAGVRALWAGLHRNAELKVLGLDNTEWTDKGAETAVRGLLAQDPSARRGPLLAELHCGGNELEEGALVALMELLDSTVPRIETISAWKCGKRHGLSKDLLTRIHDYNGRVIL
jgi:Ran GTPase-activating protein (RanGAP) involved in mRNA processing and transport